MSLKIAQLITATQQSAWYATTLVILALLSVVLLVLELTAAVSPQVIEVGQSIDLVVAYIFLADFLLGWWGNLSYLSKRDYWRENWLNLVSSIPITNEVTAILRSLRIFRAIRVIRLVRAGVGLTVSEQRRRQRRNV